MSQPNLGTIVFTFVILLFARHTFGEDENPPASKLAAEPRATWMNRAVEQLEEMDAEKRANAASLVVMTLGELNDLDRAILIAKKYLPAEKFRQCLMAIAVTNARKSRLETALAVAARIEDQASSDWARARAVQVLADSRDFPNAKRVFGMIKDSEAQDGGREFLAKALAVAGNSQEAQSYANEISELEYRRETIAEIGAVKPTEPDPVDAIPSLLLRQQLKVMLQFSQGASQRDALAAIAAAQVGDRKSLNKHLQASREATRDSLPHLRASAIALGAVALAEIGDKDRALEMIKRAQAANEEEILEVSDLFGSPVLVYLLFRLDQHDELETLMKKLADDKDKQLAYEANLGCVGASFGYFSQLDEAQKYYDRLTVPMHRLYLAIGMVDGLGLREQQELIQRERQRQ